ncbi:hypothetical protein [Streptomyces sp. NPDC127100]|uniref:hypothetical protein n=1 Tax=Streptomyces sp. NPDC127100 TaxID=3347138 RepID=UPI00366796CD
MKAHPDRPATPIAFGRANDPCGDRISPRWLPQRHSVGAPHPGTHGDESALRQLIHGRKGSGKTSVAAFMELARRSGADLVAQDLKASPLPAENRTSNPVHRPPN